MSKKMNKAAIIALTGVMAASSIQTSTVFANDNVSATQDVKQKNQILNYNQNLVIHF